MSDNYSKPWRTMLKGESDSGNPITYEATMRFCHRCGSSVLISRIPDHDAMHNQDVLPAIRKWLIHPANAMSIEVDGHTLHVSKKSFLESLNDVIKAANEAVDTELRPHSRACGWKHHDHGVACHTNCPTCHGEVI